MDDSPTPTDIPKIELEKEDDFSYTDIHDKPIEDVAVEEKKEEVEEPKEDIKPEDKEEPKPEPKEEEIDLTKVIKDTAKAVADEIKAEPEAPLPTEEEKYQQFVDDYTKKTGEEPNWMEVAKFLKDEAIKAIDEREELKQKAIEDEKKVKADWEKTQVDAFNKNIDEDLNDLYTNGKLTPVKDKDNPSDQGILERKELFKAMLEVNKEREAQGKRPVYSIKEIYYEHYKKPEAQPAGEDAPISMGKGASPQTNDEKEIDYREIRRTPFRAMIDSFRGK